MTEVAESPSAGRHLGRHRRRQRPGEPDGGTTWEEVGKNVPASNHEYYVSGLEASRYDAGTAYLALDGHRNDDLKPYIFKTTDYGKTWTSVAGNLPAFGNVNSVRQDPVNRNLLLRADGARLLRLARRRQDWNRFMPNLPIGRVDEVLVHPRDHDLILATHSRSVWIMDDVSALAGAHAGAFARRTRRCCRRATRCAWKTDRRLVTAVTGRQSGGRARMRRAARRSRTISRAVGPTTKITISDAVTRKRIPYRERLERHGTQPLAVGSLQHAHSAANAAGGLPQWIHRRRLHVRRRRSQRDAGHVSSISVGRWTRDWKSDVPRARGCLAERAVGDSRARSQRSPIGNAFQNLNGILVGQTVKAGQMNVALGINGRACILQMGPHAHGHCTTSTNRVNGTGTPSGTIYRASEAKWVMDFRRETWVDFSISLTFSTSRAPTKTGIRTGTRSGQGPLLRSPSRRDQQSMEIDRRRHRDKRCRPHLPRGSTAWPSRGSWRARSRSPT